MVDGVSQTLQLVDIRQSRTLITLANTAFDFWIEDWAEQFNKENQEYYVVVEKPAFDLTMQSENEFVERMGVEIATGGGPDIICGGMLEDALGLIEKGGLVDLTPYMEAAGMKAEDYFPATFNHWRYGEGIYGAITWLDPMGEAMSQSVLSGGVAPKNVESLVNDMLIFPEKVRASQYASANSILSVLFLKYSESLCGTVDWENGTCDFSGEIFAKILQVAKRYGDDRTMEMASLGASLGTQGLYTYTMREEQVSQGKVPVWNFFDDGCYPGYNIMYTLAINSNALCKEGAWAFLEYLLTGDLQSNYDYSRFPVKRSGFEELVQHELEEGSLLYEFGSDVAYRNIVAKAGTDDEYRTLVLAAMYAEEYKAKYDLTEEKVEEIRQLMENSRTFPVHTQEILYIIAAEAGAYYAGQKNIEEVCRIIQNRVQLYLDEHN